MIMQQEQRIQEVYFRMNKFVNATLTYSRLQKFKDSLFCFLHIIKFWDTWRVVGIPCRLYGVLE